MFAVLIAFLSPIIYAASNVLDSQVSNNLFKKNSSLFFYLGITNALVLPVLILWGGKNIFILPAEAFPYALVVAALETFGLVPYYLALKRMDTSIVCATYSLAEVLLPILAWLVLNEVLTISQYIGFFTIICATIILNLKRAKTFKIDFAFYLMILASLANMFSNVLSKKAMVGEGINWLAFAFYMTLLSNVFVLCLLLVPSFRREIISEFHTFKRHLKLLFVMEVVDRAGCLSILFSLSLLPVVVRSAIGETQPIFVLLYGLVLSRLFGPRFKEDVSKGEIIKKLICFISIIIGVVLTIR